MSTPYRSTPRLPSAPNPTPASVPYPLSNSRALKPPIHNPYDKFTQPEFDAWIGGITGALRHALGQEDAKPDARSQRDGLFDQKATERPRQTSAEDEDSADEHIDDSFAEFKARRAAGKGKARDPREGPGLGKGDIVQPIEIASSDEEEEEEVEQSILQLDEDGSEDEARVNEEEDSVLQEYAWGTGQSSSQILPPPDERGGHSLQSQVHEDEDEQYEDYGDSEDDEYGEYGEYDDDEEEEEALRGSSPQIIELLSDDDEVQEMLPAQPQQGDLSTRELYEHAADVTSFDDEEYEEWSEEEREIVPPLPSRSFVDEADRFDVSSYREEQKETGHYGHDRQNFAIQPEGPFHRSIQPSDGEGIVNEAQDLHAAEYRLHNGHHRHVEDDNTGDAEEVDEKTQPLSQDTSFPPNLDQHGSHIEIPDHWSSSRHYNQDFFSGGHVILHADGTSTPNRLAPEDNRPIVIDPEEEKLADEIEDDIQPLDTDTSFPPYQRPEEGSTDITDPWVGPTNYAEDFYSGGDVRTLPGERLDPFQLTGSADQDDGIDSFLTPGALSPTSLEQTSVNDEEGEGIRASPGTQYTTPARGRQAIPSDADIINIDDSDDEPEGGQAPVHEEMAPSQFEELYDSTYDMGVDDTSDIEEDEYSYYEGVSYYETDDVNQSGHILESEGHDELDVYEISSGPLEAPAVGTSTDKGIGDFEGQDGSDKEEPTTDEYSGPIPIKFHRDPSPQVIEPESMSVDPIAIEDVGVEGDISVEEIPANIPPSSEISTNAVIESEDISRGQQDKPTNIDSDTGVELAQEILQSAPFSPISNGLDDEKTLSSQQDSNHNAVDQSEMTTDPLIDDVRAISPSAATETINDDLISTSKQVENDGDSGQDVPSNVEKSKTSDDVTDGASIDLNAPIEVISLHSEVEEEDELIYSDEEKLERSSTEQLFDLIQVHRGPKIEPEVFKDVHISTDRVFESPAPRQPSPEISSKDEVEDNLDTHQPQHSQLSETGKVVVPGDGKPTTSDSVLLDSAKSEFSIQDVPNSVDTSISVEPSNHTSDLPATEPFVSPLPTAEPSSHPVEHKSDPSNSQTAPSLTQKPTNGSTRESVLTSVDDASFSSNSPNHSNDLLPGEPSSGSGLGVNASFNTEEKKAVADEDQQSTEKTLYNNSSADDSTVTHVDVANSSQISVPSSTPVPSLGPLVRDSETSADGVVGGSGGISAVAPTLHGNEQATTLGDAPGKSSMALMKPMLFPPVHPPTSMSDTYPYNLSNPHPSQAPVYYIRPPAVDNNALARTFVAYTKGTDTEEVLADLGGDEDDLELQYPPEHAAAAELKGVLSTINNSYTSKAAEQPEGKAEVPSELVSTADNNTDGPTQISAAHSSHVVEETTHSATPPIPIESIKSSIINASNIPDAQKSTKRKRDTSPGRLSQTSTQSSVSQKNKAKRPSKAERKRAIQKLADVPPQSGGEVIHVKPRQKDGQSQPPAESKRNSADIFGSAPTYRMLQPASRASPTTVSQKDDKFAAAPPSPTTSKLSKPVFQPPPISSLLHAHGRGRKLMTTPSLPIQLAKQVQSQKPPQPPQAIPPVSELTNPPSGLQTISEQSPPVPLAARKSPPPALPSLDIPVTTSTSAVPGASSPTLVTPVVDTPATPAETTLSPVVNATVPTPKPSLPTTPIVHTPSGPSKPARSASMTSSPVTRSHCRYHRISLPKEEDGPRIWFLVPGCSLNDKELMEEEEIQDHGDAVVEDSYRMIKDLDSLNLHSDLIGVLRQLVGLDILREQEVFYLPQPGEEPPRKNLTKKSLVERSALMRVPVDSSSHAGSPEYSGGYPGSPGSFIGTASARGSRSPSLSGLRSFLDSEKGSSIGPDNGHTDDDVPETKRARPTPPGENIKMGPPSSIQAKGKEKIKKSRKSKTKSDSQDAEAESSGRKSRISTSKRGIKRSRTSEVLGTTEGDEPSSKKLKAHPSEPTPLNGNSEES